MSENSTYVDEVDRLRARVAVLEVALKPFADVAKEWLANEITQGDARAGIAYYERAEAVLSGSPSTPGEAWRAMVEALGGLYRAGYWITDDAPHDEQVRLWEQAKVALTLAQVVMGVDPKTSGEAR